MLTFYVDVNSDDSVPELAAHWGGIRRTELEDWRQERRRSSDLSDGRCGVRNRPPQFSAGLAGRHCGHLSDSGKGAPSDGRAAWNEETGVNPHFPSRGPGS